MVRGIRRAAREATLRPARWSVRPQGRTLLRVVLVTALLALATGVLYGRDSPASPCAGSPPLAAGSTGSSRPPGWVGAPGPPSGSPTAPGPAPEDGAPPLPAGLVGVPVRIADPTALAVVRAGGRVDLLAVPTGTGRSAEPALVAAGALVLDVIDATTVDGAPADGTGGLYLALPPEQAHRAVGLPDGARFAIIVRP